MDHNRRGARADAFARTPTVKKNTPYRQTRESILQLSGIRDKISRWNLENNGAAVHRAAASTPVIRPKSVHRTQAPTPATPSSSSSSPIGRAPVNPASVVFNTGQDQRTAQGQHAKTLTLPLPGPKPNLPPDGHHAMQTHPPLAPLAAGPRRASVSLSMSDLLTKDLAALRNAVKGLKNLTLPHSSNHSVPQPSPAGRRDTPERYDRDDDNDVVMGEASQSPSLSSPPPPPPAVDSCSHPYEGLRRTAVEESPKAGSSTLSSTDNPLFDENDDGAKRTTPPSVTGKTFRRLSDLRIEKDDPRSQGALLAASSAATAGTPMHRPLLRQSFMSSGPDNPLMFADSAAKRGIALATKLQAAARDLLETSTTPSANPSHKMLKASPSPMVFPKVPSPLVDKDRALRDEYKAAADTAMKERDEALELLQNYKETVANLQDAHSRELIGVKGEAVLLRSDLEDVRKRFETLYRDKYVPLKRQVEVLCQEKDELRARLSEVNAEKTKLEEVVARFTLKDKERNERYRSLTKTLEATVQRAKVTSDAKERLARDIERKEDEIRTLEDRVNNLSRSLNEIKSENETLITTRRRHQGRISDLEAQLAEKSAEVESMSCALTAMCDDLLDASTHLTCL